MEWNSQKKMGEISMEEKKKRKWKIKIEMKDRKCKKIK